MESKQRLVCSDDMLAGSYRLKNKTPGRFVAADQFNDNADLRIVEYCVYITCKNTR